MARSCFSSLEPLEARIAPAALTVFNPLPNLVPAAGQTSQSINLATSLNSSVTTGYDTLVNLVTNFDTNPLKPGLQAGVITIELFNNETPLTVENFLHYVESGEYNGVFFSRLVSGFVLQTGGYNISHPGTHIATAPTVHNEFNTSNPDYSNVVESGDEMTVAMAKTGVSPNTASSEFFFNLADNSSNLNYQNGGFTVFGKVIAGMDVVNAITSMNQSDLSGITGNSALTNVPTQNGYSTNAGKTPAADQYVVITKAYAVAPSAAEVAHTAYSIVSITNTQSGAPTNLVTGKLSGSNLSLGFNHAADGVYSVMVQAENTQTGAAVTESFTVSLAPNITTSVSSDTFQPNIAAGDTGDVKVKLVNTGNTTLTGNVDVTFYLSNAAGPDPYDTLTASNGILLESLTNVAVNVASGASFSIDSGKLTIPTNNANLTPGTYIVMADITTSSGSTVVEQFTDDNVSLNGSTHNFYAGAATSNLVADQLYETLPAGLIPGSTGAATISIQNTASLAAAGAVNVQLYLEHADGYSYQNVSGTIEQVPNGPDPTGTILNTATDPLLGEIMGQQVYIAAGGSATLQIALTVPSSMTLPVGDDRVIALVTPATGSPITQVSTAGNQYNGNLHNLEYYFGKVSYTDQNIGKVSWDNPSLSYTDGNGKTATLTLTGGGFGNLIENADGSVDLSVTNSTLKTTLSSTGGTAELNNISIGQPGNPSETAVTSPIGSVALSHINLLGNFIDYGGAKSVTLGNMVGSGSQFIGLDASSATANLPATLHLGSIAVASASGAALDTQISSTQPVGSATYSYTDINNEVVNLSITGGGYANIVTNSDGSLSLNAQGTTLKTTLAASTVNGVHSQLQDITIGSSATASPIGALSLGEIDLLGSFQDYGGASSIALGSIAGAGDHSITITGSTATANVSADVTLGAMINTSFSSTQGLGSLSASSWITNDSSSPTISLAGVHSISIQGNLEANLTDSTTGAAPLLSKLSVTGAVVDSTIQINANIGAVTIGALDTSNFLVGASAVPATTAGFTATDSVASFDLVGGVSGESSALINSNIAAAVIHSINIQSETGSSGTAAFGVLAGKIASYTRGSIVKTNLTQPGALFDMDGNYEAVILPA